MMLFKEPRERALPIKDRFVFVVRILVERPIYEQFVEALVEQVSSLKVGNPSDPGNRHA